MKGPTDPDSISKWAIEPTDPTSLAQWAVMRALQAGAELLELARDGRYSVDGLAQAAEAYARAYERIQRLERERIDREDAHARELDRARRS
jgi:hypothetical protein